MPEHVFLATFFFLLPMTYSGITTVNEVVVESDVSVAPLVWSSVTGLVNTMRLSSPVNIKDILFGGLLWPHLLTSKL